MKKKILIGVIDNGMGLSRTSWAVCLANACLSVLTDYDVQFASISYPYCAGALNKLSHAFLASDREEVIVIDTDIVFRPEHLRFLLEHNEPLVFGLYPKKQIGLTYPTIPLDNDANPFSGNNVLCEVKATARGFMRMHRSVLERISEICERYPDPLTGEMRVEYWKTLPGDHSEDFRFCEEWRSIGGKILIDKRITAQHEGSIVFPIKGTF